MSDATTTARLMREARRAGFSRSLARLLLAHDLSQAEAARLCGVGDSIVQEWCDPEKPRAMSLADAMALPPELRLVLAELLAGPGAVVAIVPEGSPRLSVNTALSVQKETSEVVTGHLAAIADGGGAITRSQATPLRREVREAQRALATLDRGLEVVEREGVVSIDRRRTG